MTRLGVRSASLALLVSLGAGLAAGLLPGRGDAPTDYDSRVLEAAARAEPGDRVAAAIEGVREDGLHVAPELAGLLSEEKTAELERAVAGSPVPLHVVWWESTYEGGPANDFAAMAQLRAGIGEEGYYAVISPGRPIVVDAVGLEEPFVDADGLGRPAVALASVVEELAAAPPKPLQELTSDYWGGRGGGIAAGLLFVALGYGALVAVVWVLGRTVGRMGP